jgi:hypothetical protein
MTALPLTLIAPYADTLTAEERHDGVLVRIVFTENKDGTSFVKHYSDHFSESFGPFPASERAGTEELIGNHLEEGFTAEFVGGETVFA